MAVSTEQVFIKEFLEGIEAQALKNGFIEKLLLDEMLQYIERETEPEYIDYSNDKYKIKVNAYSFDEEENILDLYVIDYDIEQTEEQMKTVSMTQLNEMANKAKKFIVNTDKLKIDQSREAYELLKIVEKNSLSFSGVNIFLLTNLIYKSNKPIELNIANVPEVNVQVWDLDRVFQLANAEQGVADIYIDFEEQFGQTFELMYVPDPQKGKEKNNFDCYIGFIPAKLLAEAYDIWGPKLVERNVRSFLQARAGTNKGIRDTLKDSKERQMFVAYNNGISSVASAGEIEQVHEDVNLYRIKRLKGWQIVNGGQTTASIHQAFKSDIDLEDVYIQTKLTLLQFDKNENEDMHAAEDSMVSKISKYANTQNKINPSDLLANSRFMSSLEQQSRITWVPYNDGRKSDKKWYFERARGQYMVDLGRRNRGKQQNDFKKMHPADLVIKKVDLAKMYMSWEQYPHVASKGGEAAFKKFMDLNKEFWNYEKDENNKDIKLTEFTQEMYQEFIARIIINNQVKEIVENQQLKGYKANVIYYTVSMLSFLYGNKISLQEVWDNQKISDKWVSIIDVIARTTLEFLKSSAGDQNITQWAKKEECWKLYTETCSKRLRNLS